MPEMKEPGTPGARGTVRRRGRYSRETRSGRVSRPLLVALIIVLAGGAYLFWPRGGSAPTGIGDQLSVVTADSALAQAPRSGSVDIQQERQPLVPERPAGERQSTAVDADRSSLPESMASAVEQRPDLVPESPGPTGPDSRPDDAVTTAPQPRTITPAIKPRETGPWAVQIDAFEVEANADKKVTDLAAKGVTAHVRAISTASGGMIYRVWIGWFDSRQEAIAYAEQAKGQIGEAYPVHR
ncbi:MAG TPA: SPOR domain-containing protein [Candidatus Krumholzibacteria bacterium]|nr:SPOR domain-containing protein [Candidatus Krumholzibacteria bacterium]HPD72449.1 SPOR domain-containing protein [Candidatus Krumholzibacteria bacterium]HRY40619.1 SPOR domain-containing protein [Candidatus Krumholzibacteria bacterium]